MARLELVIHTHHVEQKNSAQIMANDQNFVFLAVSAFCIKCIATMYAFIRDDFFHIISTCQTT